MNRKRGVLGSGLGALIPNDPVQTPAGVRNVPVSSIRQNPRQPRTHFEESALADLAASIREHGIIQPLIVSEPAPGEYELIAGERRWRAAQRAGLEQVPVLVRETTPQQLLELALIENVQRADLNPLEEAQAYQSLKDEFHLTDDQIAVRLGITSRVTITNTRRLLRLPDEAKAALLEQRISAGHGRAILKLDAPDQQLAALDAILEAELSVRDAERLGDLAQRLGDVPTALEQLRPRPRPGQAAVPHPARVERTNTTPRLSPDDQAVERELSATLGTPVRLARADTELRVTITFYDDEKLQEFYDLLGGIQRG
jgi:ParB family transcriptional regulator, chromosome partitioning protein